MSLEDERLIELARGSAELSVREMAAEILRLRRFLRLDSRRAKQLERIGRHLESAVDRVLEKIDEVSTGATPEELAVTEPPWLADAARALGCVAPNGTPLALNWTQVLTLIEDLRRDRDRLQSARGPDE